MRLSALAGGNPTHHVGTVLDHLLRMEGALASGEALHDDLALLVDEYAHFSFFGC